MSSTAEMTERHGRALAELADLGLSLARGLHGRALAAQTDEAAERLALAFHRVSRSVRMTLALEARLAREERQGWRDERARIGYVADRRKAQLRAAVTRAVLSETEGEAAEGLLEELDERLDEAALADDFTQGPVEALVARIRADLGLAAALADDAANDPAGDPGPRNATPTLADPIPAWQAAGPPIRTPDPGGGAREGGWLG